MDSPALSQGDDVRVDQLALGWIAYQSKLLASLRHSRACRGNLADYTSAQAHRVSAGDQEGCLDSATRREAGSDRQETYQMVSCVPVTPNEIL